MLNCPHLTNGVCGVATTLANGVKCTPFGIACEQCSNEPTPYEPNAVTVGLAVHSLITAGNPKLATSVALRWPFARPAPSLKCIHRSEKLATVDGDLIDCKCPSIVIYKCNIHDECVVRNLKEEVSELLHRMRPSWNKEDICSRCKDRLDK